MREKGTILESVIHPDLVALGRVLRARMDRTLDAEMEAARAAARRRTSIRDRLLDAEDRSATVSISTLDGSIRRGIVDAVGSDHVELSHAGTRFAIAIQHISIVEERP